MDELKVQSVQRCHNCGRYYDLSFYNSTTCCSDECTKEYIEYLNESVKNNRWN